MANLLYSFYSLTHEAKTNQFYSYVEPRHLKVVAIATKQFHSTICKERNCIYCASVHIEKNTLFCIEMNYKSSWTHCEKLRLCGQWNVARKWSKEMQCQVRLSYIYRLSAALLKSYKNVPFTFNNITLFLSAMSATFYHNNSILCKKNKMLIVLTITF